MSIQYEGETTALQRGEHLCSGHVLAVSGRVLAVFWPNMLTPTGHSGHVLAMSWPCSGHVLAMSWWCSGYVLAMFWPWSGHALVMFWLLWPWSGHGLAMANDALF